MARPPGALCIAHSLPVVLDAVMRRGSLYGAARELGHDRTALRRFLRRHGVRIVRRDPLVIEHRRNPE